MPAKNQLSYDVYLLGLGKFTARFPKIDFTVVEINGKAVSPNVAAWYEDLKDEISDDAYLLAVQMLCKSADEWGPWKNFGASVLKFKDAANDVITRKERKMLERSEQRPALDSVGAERHKQFLRELRENLAVGHRF